MPRRAVRRAISIEIGKGEDGATPRLDQEGRAVRLTNLREVCIAADVGPPVCQVEHEGHVGHQSRGSTVAMHANCRRPGQVADDRQAASHQRADVHVPCVAQCAHGSLHLRVAVNSEQRAALRRELGNLAYARGPYSVIGCWNSRDHMFHNRRAPQAV
eukprot:CAMPEP_0174763580 /NCGR_PEP_ID=MMETSP1094-20130205/110351_1 /TAXON_ID=156173 /ORGANISM="Chrysochromulina brevifilum, Strain UTEX LB 985" /LENGTH=157 /DNA_ID=CAMNT_0015969537 /DNA_START=606 /DNA_END=1079 /DNA_ORIENTATION=+